MKELENHMVIDSYYSWYENPPEDPGISDIDDLDDDPDLEDEECRRYFEELDREEREK